MMLLKSLEIDRERKWDNPPSGKLKGQVEFANQQGLIKFELTEEDAIAILQLCAVRIQARVTESAKAMYMSLEEQTKLIASESVKD